MSDHIKLTGEIPQDEQIFKERYRVVFARLGVSVVEWDLEHDSFYCSASYNNYVVSEKDQITLPEHGVYPDTVHPDDYEVLKDFTRRFGAGENHLDVVVRVAMKDGGYRWTHLCNDRVVSDTGETLRVIITYMDVDEEYRAKQKLQATTRRLTNLISSLPVGVGIFKADTSLQPEYVSDTACEIFGYTQQEVESLFESGQHLSLLPAGEHISEETLAALKAGESKEFNVKAKRKDGKRIWVRITCAARLGDDGEYHCYVTFMDVSDSVVAEYKYRMQAERYRILSEASDVITFDYDPLTDTMSYNLSTQDEGLQAFVSENYVAKIEDNRRIHPDSIGAFVENKKRAMAGPTEGHFEYLADIDDGGYRWKRVSYVSLADDANQVYRVVGRLDDVHDELSKLKRDAQVDGITGILNKIASRRSVESALARSGRAGTDALFIIDLDNFKSVNDTLGHVEGDRILSETGRTLQKLVRETDIVGRFGGDEFIIFMPNMNARLVTERAEALKNALAGIAMGELGNLTISVGIALLQPDHSDFESAMRKADSALYEAKNLGKNCYVIHE